jgi:hypothetical protein
MFEVFFLHFLTTFLQHISFYTLYLHQPNQFLKMKKLFVLFAAATLFVGVQACKQAEEATDEVVETTEEVADEVVETVDSNVAVIDSTVQAH